MGLTLFGMKSHTEYLTFNTRHEHEYVHITPQVEKAVQQSGIREGLALVSAMHITAGVYVNDNEDGLIEDIEAWLEKLAPRNPGYKHHQTGESNGDAHLKSMLVHHQVICADYLRKAGSWPMAARVLRRVRWPEE